MPDFKDIQKDLHNARAQKAQAAEALFSAKEKIGRIEQELRALERIQNANNPRYLQRKADLDGQRKAIRAQIDRWEKGLSAAEKLEGQHWEALLPFTDPREGIRHLNDQIPFLLFPVRIETRFKRGISVEGRPENQLWVRIFPDDCLIDTFEPLLSESEVKSARIFWTEMWRAGGLEPGQRGAWRGLVTAHGSGRAAWIYDHFKPLNEGDKPVKNNADEVVLVINQQIASPGTLPYSAAEQSAAFTFWEAVWRSNGVESSLNAAKAQFEAAVGKPKAEAMMRDFRPANLEEAPPAGKSRADAVVKVAVLVLPPPDELDTRRHGWSRAPKVRLLPDRFVLLGYRGGKLEVQEVGRPVPAELVVGPDPSAKEKPSLQQQDDELIVGDDIRWMTDFDEAVRIGMGFRIPLTTEQAKAGFDRLLVTGVRLSTDAQESRLGLENLLQHHQFSSTGFGLLPQGAPTNNTESKGSAFSRADDADESYDLVFGLKIPPPPTADWRLKRDGQWLAESLGLDPAIFAKTLHADGLDQCEARAMNAALWPATMGFLMDTMMQEVFSEDAVEATREFFKRFVQGRGPVPALRIGRQPYGILPTSAFSRLRWMSRTRFHTHAVGTPASFLARLYQVLLLMHADWDQLKQRADWVGKAGDAHQTLLNIIGLHPASVEFHQRFTPGRQFLWNLFLLANAGNSQLPETPDMAEGLDDDGMALLQKFGHTGTEKPDILDKIFQRRAPKLQGPVIDDRPLSETDPVRSYTPPALPAYPAGKNYIQWLLDAAGNPETLRKEEGFLDNKPPTALLYLMLRHALQEGYHDAGMRFYQLAEVAEPQALRQAKKDAPFIHVQDDASRQSKYEWLYARESRISDKLVVDHVAERLFKDTVETRYLTEQLQALKHLEYTPTARLERLFAEHIDACSYRLDAWKTGLLHYQLNLMRQSGDQEGEPETGIYLGAFGWLENVRPENKTLKPVELPEELKSHFAKKGDPLLVRDDTNQGYILAPSLNHAVTAAVLRNGYLANATPANPETLAVNLSSERVRLALSVIEGIRNGQSLAALLGYQLERGLHDRYDDLRDFSVDDVIYDLRLAFPLTGGQLAKSAEDDSKEAIEARNVVNGLDLVNHIKKTGNKNYPFGLSSKLPAVPEADRRKAIDEEVDRIRNIHDAVADVALAETVYQVTLGNYERAGATLDAYGKGNFAPEPEVVQTPRSGVALTHRVGLHLDPAAVLPAQATPRALAEPALNAWLRARMPDLALTGTRASWFQADGTGTSAFITATQLGLQPIDLLYLSNPEDDKSMSELDDRIEHFVRSQPGVRQESGVMILYTEQEAGRFTFFELAPLLKSLRALALQSRPLRPSDLALPEEALKELDQQPAFIDDRAGTIRQFLDNSFVNLRAQLNALTAPVKAHYDALSALQEQLENPNPGDDMDALKVQIFNKRSDIIQSLDGLLTGLAPLFLEAGLYGLSGTGTGAMYEDRKRMLSLMRNRSADYRQRWVEKLKQYDDALLAFEAIKADATIPEIQKVDLLHRADYQISTAPVSGDTIVALEGPVKALRLPFLNKLTDLEDLLNAAPTGLSGQWQAIQTFLSAAPAATTFDLQGIDLAEAEKQLLTLGIDLLERAANLQRDLDKTVAAGPAGKAATKLSAHDSSAVPAARLKALEEATQMLFGEHFHLIPSYSLPSDLSAEWQNAWNNSGNLLTFQREKLGNDFPEEDWLHGVARVREKMSHWENITLLAQPFGAIDPGLQPTQFPLKANDRWLALQFRQPEETEVDFPSPQADHLLYTAHPAPVFDPGRICGLLIDEWTEVLPGTEETAGLTFHFDKPNSEPPQAWLLVTPTDFRQSWQWEDLVDALHETLEAAKQRAVEPAFVDDTPYARFLPATMATVTTYPITIALNFALNNQYYQLLSTQPDNG